MTALKDLYRVDHQALVQWVCKTYGITSISAVGDNPHRNRRESTAVRLNLYRDKAAIPIGGIIDRLYKTQERQDELKEYIDVACEQNVSARIVNEIANLYDRPALRILKDEAANKRFHEEEQRLNLHFVFQEAHRLTNLCNETLLWQFTGIDSKTALRIITPDAFDAVPDPRDQLVPAGYLLDAPRASAWSHEHNQRLPRYELWDSEFKYLINGHGQIVDEDGNVVVAPEPHGLSRIPGVLFHRREPTTCILDGTYGDDIKSAHLGVALLNIMAMSLAKSQGENMMVLSGNLAQMATRQVMHPERPIALPPGVTLEMLQLKTDPEHYLMLKRDKLASVGARYGLSYETFMLEFGGDGSGKGYQVRREKLTELRVEQRGRAKKHEVMTVELIGFDPAGMRTDFQEQAIPQDAGEEVDLLDKKMRKGLDSPVSYLQRQDPDLAREDAIDLLKKNLADFAMLIVWVRALNVPAEGDAAQPGQSPQQNGANNSGEKPPNGDGSANSGDSSAPAYAA